MPSQQMDTFAIEQGCHHSVNKFGTFWVQSAGTITIHADLRAFFDIMRTNSLMKMSPTKMSTISNLFFAKMALFLL